MYMCMLGEVLCGAGGSIAKIKILRAVLLRVLILLYMCPHVSIYVSSCAACAARQALARRLAALARRRRHQLRDALPPALLLRAP